MFDGLPILPPMKFAKKFRYRFGDIDDAGIAYYPSFFHYFHQVFEDWWQDALGIPYAEVLHEQHFGLPAVHIESDFLGQIRYGDEPWIGLRIIGIGKHSVHFEFWMSKDEEGCERLAVARTRTVSVDMRDMTKKPIPQTWMKIFEEWLEEPGPSPFRKDQ